MRYVELGSQGMVVSAEGLGCMGMTSTYGPSSELGNNSTLTRALDLGITFFDTAEVYGPFLNEELLGRFFAGRRSNVVLATKVGFKIAENGDREVVSGKPTVTGDPDHLRSAIEGSLRRLKTDFIDLLYLHRIDPHTPIEETIGALATLVSEGKIRYVGVSEASAHTIRKAHAVHPITAVQTEYSLFERGVEQNGVLSTTRELGIGFVSYSPLGRGFLSGNIKDSESFAQTDFRRSDPRFQGENLAINLKLVNNIELIAAAKGVSPSQLALAWTLHQDTVPIPGTQRMEYLQENVAAIDINLTQEDLLALGSAAPIGAAVGDRYAKGILDTIDQ